MGAPPRGVRVHKNLSALVLVLALVGCGSEEPAPDPAPKPVTPARPAGPTAAESDLVGARAVVLSTAAGTDAHVAAAALKALSAEGGTPIAHVVTPSALEALYFVAAGEAEAAVIPAVLLASPEHRVARDAVDVLATFQGPIVAAHVARGSGVKELMDLEGKRVVLGAPGSALAAAAVQLLEAAGLDETSVDASYHAPAEAMAALKAGKVDAVFAFEDQGEVEGAEHVALAEDERAALQGRAGVFTVDEKGARANLVLVARRGPTGVEAFAPLVAADPKRLRVLDAPKPAPISGPSLALRNGTAPLRVAGGPEGGTYEVVAGGLQKVGQGADVAVLPMRTAGSLSNLLALATGHAELAIVQEDVLLEMLRTPTLAPLAARVRLVAPLFQEQVHLAAAGGMGSIDGLRGKRVGCGDPGSGTFFTVRRVLRRANVSRADATLSLTPVAASLEALAAGKLDAVFAVGGAPLPAFDQAKQPFVALGDVDGYTESSLGPDQYGWLKAPVTTIATRALLLCRLDLDDTTVKRLVTSLYANRKNLTAVHPALGQLVPSQLEGGLEGLRIHEGAKAASMGGLEVDTAPGW
jgi:TRAP transporter TAXI family solute receptor